VLPVFARAYPSQHISALTAKLISTICHQYGMRDANATLMSERTPKKPMTRTSPVCKYMVIRLTFMRAAMV
jgi:hypothetical protein